MPSPLELAMPSGPIISIKSEKQTPQKETEMGHGVQIPETTLTANDNDSSSKKVFEPDEIVSAEDIHLESVERAISPSDGGPIVPSSISNMEFEEAVNTDFLSPVTSPGNLTPSKKTTTVTA